MVSLLSGEGPNIPAPCCPLCLGQAVSPGLALQRVGRGWVIQCLNLLA